MGKFHKRASDPPRIVVAAIGFSIYCEASQMLSNRALPTDENRFRFGRSDSPNSWRYQARNNWRAAKEKMMSDSEMCSRRRFKKSNLSRPANSRVVWIIERPPRKFMRYSRWFFGAEIDFSVSVMSGRICFHWDHDRSSISQLGVWRDSAMKSYRILKVNVPDEPYRAESRFEAIWNHIISKSLPEIRFFRRFWRGFLPRDIGGTIARAVLEL
jgi:hypothetical protein